MSKLEINLDRQLIVRNRINATNKDGQKVGYAEIDENPITCFMVEDLRYILMDGSIHNPMLQITDLFVNEEIRNNGIGSKLIDNIVSNNMNSVIFIDAAPHKKDFTHYTYDELDEKELKLWDENMSKLVRFLESKGFKNVNDRIGCYEFSEVFLYTGNEIGKNVHERIYSDTQRMS